MASLGGEYDVVLVARADGALAADVRPLVRLSVTVIAEQNGRRESGTRRRRRPLRLRATSPTQVLDEYADAGGAQALVNLEARPAPAGTMTVVLGPGWPGILLHEAIGHGLEGDFNRKGTLGVLRPHRRSASPRRASPWSTTARCPDRRGSLNVDDEGTPTQRNVLIEDGILRGYMQDTPERAPDEDAAHRQRPARVLRAPADAAHDQHLHARRRRTTRRRSSRR